MRKLFIPDRAGQLHPIKIYDVNEFDYTGLFDKMEYLKDYRNSDYVADCISAFDIETSTASKDLAWMYVWQWCILYKGYYHVIVGRTWEEFEAHMLKLDLMLNGRRIITWVHNLGYEYQFMYNFIGSHEVFAVKSRMPVKVKLSDLSHEFRCSWKLTNMSLKEAGKKEPGVTYLKKDEAIDYSAIRFPDTPINDSDMQYNVLDVVSLCDIIQNKLYNNNDTLVTIPLTSTGYVRRKCRNRVRKDMPKYREEVFLKNQINSDVYKLLKQAARGGNTHANRYFVKSIL